MTTADRPDDPDQTGGALTETERARRRARVFGEVLPDTTADERKHGADTEQHDREDGGDEWLRANVPPHHGS